MRVTRRTIRTAAIATGTIAALAVPTAGAFAADHPAPAPVPAPVPTAGQGAEPDQPEVLPDEQRQPRTGPPVERAFIQSYRLADGSVAKVYQTGTDRYSAEIWAGGTLIDTLATTGSPAYGQNNGLHVVLQPDGSVASWTEGDKPAPKPEPKPEPKPKPRPVPDKKVQRKAASSVTLTTPDGRIAKLVKGSHGPRVVISQPDGRRLATLDPKHATAHHGGWSYRLVVVGKGEYRFVVVDTPKQGGNSWVYDFRGKLVEKYRAEKHTTRSTTVVAPPSAARTDVPRIDVPRIDVPRADVPQGAVKAGAEKVAGSAHEATLIGAGGGLAALGAAGLGFALHHRRSPRQD
ncbi:hypothetical protein [Streptomyces sp. NPDC013457]|uniref:hypothetical protein n=1 Tax=Streptomyces sp. NPDC013457 TaxID=3364866 RepID=UPI0036F8C0EC